MVAKFFIIVVAVANFHLPKASSNGTNHQIDKNADFETVSLLFEAEDISSSLPIYHSDTDLSIYNDTRSVGEEVSINIEAEARVESGEGHRNKPKQPRITTRLEIAERTLSVVLLISPYIISVVAVVWATCIH